LKFAPVTLRVRALLPGAAVVGDSAVMAGTGLLTVNDVTTDGFPPGFSTLTKGVPATAIALAGMDACNVVEFVYAEETVADPNFTIEVGANPVPTIVSVKDGPPAVALAGLNPPTVGCVLDGSIVIVAAGDVPPLEKPTPNSGFLTEMAIVPGDAMAEAATVVVNCVELTNVNGCTAPLKSSVAPCTKFVPLMVSEKPGDPATTLGALIEEIVGDP
jgi:hypothetical protein